MPACTQKLHLGRVNAGATLAVGTQGNANDYSTSIFMISDVDPPGTRVFAHSTTANKTRQITAPGAPHRTGLRFRTTFKSAAATTVTLVVDGANGDPLTCDVTGQNGDAADIRFYTLTSV